VGFLTPTHLGNAGLVRRRLLDELACLRTARLALIVAPAGAGKTTLLAQMAERWDGPLGWWHAEPADTTVQCVVRNLWRAIPALSGVAPPADLDRPLAALCTTGGATTLLVVDDVHYLAGTDAEVALEAVIIRQAFTSTADGGRTYGINTPRRGRCTGR
jgi:ATP/maltotriose-dependent transcriptional regulator MalT